MKEEIKNGLGPSFGPASQFTGLIFFMLGIFTFGIGIGIILVLIGGVMTFSRYGVIIDPEYKRYKCYYSYFGIKYGKWEDLTDFVEITVLKSNKSWLPYVKKHKSLLLPTHAICL